MKTAQAKQPGKPIRQCHKCGKLFLWVKNTVRRGCESCHRESTRVVVNRPLDDPKRAAKSGSLIEVICTECGQAAMVWRGSKTTGLFCSRACAGRNKSRLAQVRFRERETLDDDEKSAEQSAKSVSRGVLKWIQTSIIANRPAALSMLCGRCGTQFMKPNNGRASDMCTKCRMAEERGSVARTVHKRKYKGINRRRIWEHDSYICYLCGIKCDAPPLTGGWSSTMATIDHVIPFSRGGTNQRSNLKTCCATCNKAKGVSLIR